MLKKFFSIAVLCITTAAGTQTPSIIQHIRFPVWAELDAYPGLAEAEKVTGGVYDFSIARIRQMAPFLISGMIFGWEFSYTPYDKSRNVSEYFSCTPIQKDETYLRRIRYSEPRITENSLHCWVEYTRTPDMVRVYNQWTAIGHPAVRGLGEAPIAHGFDGIVEAAQDAVKNAVRNHFRGQIKNKPKEITGRVLIRRAPEIGVRAGKYVIQLDFFLEKDTIIPYTMY